MAFSEVKIKVNSIPSTSSVLTIGDNTTINLTETFLLNRTAAYQTALTASPTIEVVTNNLWDALNKDYNLFFTYSIILNELTDEITIVARNEGVIFTEETNTTAGAITLTITNGTPLPTLSIDTVVVSEATVGSPDTTVKFTVTTTPQSDYIYSPINQAVATNPIIFETTRGAQIDIEVGLGSLRKTYKARVPQLLSAYFNVEVISTPSGGIVTATRLFPLTLQSQDFYNLLLSFEYSLDNTIWGSSNSWSGVEAGAKTVYIRDNIGGTLQIPFTVEAFDNNTNPDIITFDPVIKISNVNPIRFKINEVWDTNGIQKNITNTLSFEENTKINDRRFLQHFQKNDVIKTQIQSNYTNLTATLIDCENNETNLTVVQQTSNMGIRDVRDGRIRILQDGSIGVYFGSGSTYDPDTLSVIGSYNLNEFVMDWVEVGKYLNVEGIGWGKITSISAPTSSLAFYLVELALDNTLNYTQGQTVKITTIYNQADFERFEFEVDCSTLEGDYYVKVNATDGNFDDVEFISEWLQIKTTWTRHHIIEYYATRNNEINYGTGITFELRLPYAVTLQWKPSTEQEIYVTDTATTNLDSKVREFYELNLLPLPTVMAQKVVLILAHNRIFIDGLSYLLEGEPETVRLGVSNLYTVKANLVKSDYVFDATTGTTSSEILLDSGVPLLIDENAIGLLFIE